MAKNQNESTLLGVRISPEVKAKLESEAKRRHLTVNELVAETLNGNAQPGNPNNPEHDKPEHHFDAETKEKMAAFRQVVKEAVRETLAEIEAEQADNKAAEEEEKKRKRGWPLD